MNAVLELPVAGETLDVTPAGQLVVSTAALAFLVDPDSGAITATPHRSGGAAIRRDDPAVALPARGLRLDVVETARGPVSRLSGADGTELAAFAGTLASVALDGQGVFAGAVRLAGGTWELVAGRLGDRRVLRFPGGGGAACAGDDFVAITGATPCVLHLFVAHGDFLSRVTVARPEPEGSAGRALLLGSAIWVLAGRMLTRIDLAALPRGADHALAATYHPLVPPARESAETAKVAFALATGSVGLDHPRLGRIVMTRGPEEPPLARGDEIVLDDVAEELPGVFRVRSWHPKGAGRTNRPPPPPVVLEAPRVHAVLVEGEALPPRPPKLGEPGALVRALQTLASEHGFTAPALLVRLFREADGDDVVRRWLSILGCEPEVYFPCPDWNADPFLVSFGAVGNGDAYCLYPYPPALAASGEPPVVEFFHETNTWELRAASFDVFFAWFLARARSEPDVAPIVDLLAARLGLSGLVEQAPPAEPPWVTTPETNAKALARAEALVTRGEAIAAERLLVGLWLGDGEAASEARDRLERLYQDLGWTLPVAALRS